jgi:hypothetical protein
VDTGPPARIDQYLGPIAGDAEVVFPTSFRRPHIVPSDWLSDTRQELPTPRRSLHDQAND